jgi:hypothetical protein
MRIDISRSRQCAYLYIALSVAVGHGVLVAQETSRPNQGLHITDLRAQLFYSDRGTFSENIVGRPDLALWNVIIGGGDSGGPSHAILVVVEITGSRESRQSTARLRLSVTGGGKTILARSQAVPSLNATGIGYVAFWLYDTGCVPLALTATIVGQPASSTKRAAIGFACGE